MLIFSYHITLKVPMQALSEAKREYVSKDLQDWEKYRGIQFQFTSTFPFVPFFHWEWRLQTQMTDCDKLCVSGKTSGAA